MAYPVFVALFAFMFFGDMRLNTGAVRGGTLVFAGSRSWS